MGVCVAEGVDAEMALVEGRMGEKRSSHFVKGHS